MAENQSKTNRDKLNERMLAKYPERQFADDEELYGQIGSDYDEYDKQIGEYKDRESKLTDVFAKNPRAAQFLTDMAKGEDPWLAVIERMGIDGITELMNDPDKQEAYAAANKKYVESMAKEQAMQAECEQNIADSMKMLEQMQQEKGLSDESIDAAIEFIIKMGNEAIMGKFSRESVELALKAINHDANVENARSEGTIAGRNEKIDEKMRKAASGDGMPALGGSNNVPSRRNGGNNSIFDMARDAK